MNPKAEDVSQDTLNEVFLSRSKIGKYFSIPDDKRDIMLQYFQKNPYPKKEELIFLSNCTHIEKSKIQNWFKYQRQKDFKTSKSIIKTYKCNRKFSREGKKILELYFRKNHDLTENALNKLSVLLKCDKSQIERWFYYRNKKLNSLLNKKDKDSEIEEERDETNLSTVSKTSVSRKETPSENTQDKTTPSPIKSTEKLESVPFTFPSFPLPPPPPLIASQMLLANSMPSFLSKPPSAFWNNLSFISGLMMKRSEIYQKSLAGFMESNMKKEDVKKEELKRDEVKKEEERTEGLNVKKEE